MKPRTGQVPRLREPRLDPQPPQHERDDERLIQPVELPDGEDDSDEEEPEDGHLPADPVQEDPPGPRLSPGSCSVLQDSIDEEEPLLPRRRCHNFMVISVLLISCQITLQMLVVMTSVQVSHIIKVVADVLR